MSDLGLPLIDIRDFSAKKQGPKVTALTMYKVWTHPALVGVVVLAILLGALGVLISVYIPQYRDFQNGCVKSENGTMITHNAYAFAYNFAALEFNREGPNLLSEHDQIRYGYCAKNGQESQILQQESETSVGNSRAEYDKVSKDMALFDLCINYSSPAFPTEVQLTPYLVPDENHTRHYPFDAPGRVEWDGRLDCEVPGKYGSQGLSDAIFNCTLLPTCNLTCSGPDRVAIQAATFDSGCQSEYMVHAGLFRFALALLVYVCMNISRVLVMTALIRLCWRALSERGFEYIGSCNRLGQMTPESQEKLKTKTDQVIRRFEGVSFLMLFIAVLIHIPYIVVLTQYGDTFATDAPK
jgi:hypothetical protein